MTEEYPKRLYVYMEVDVWTGTDGEENKNTSFFAGEQPGEVATDIDGAKIAVYELVEMGKVETTHEFISDGPVEKSLTDLIDLKLNVVGPATGRFPTASGGAYIIRGEQEDTN